MKLKLLFLIFILLYSTNLVAQKFNIEGTNYQVVLIDPPNKRVFIAYYSEFNNSKKSDSAIVKNLGKIASFTKDYVKSMFLLEDISFFSNRASFPPE